jgi:hypothetical protein
MATEKEKAEQCQHAGGGCLAHGSAFTASQPDRPGSVSQARPTAGIDPTGLGFDALANAYFGCGRFPEALEANRRAAELAVVHQN